MPVHFQNLGSYQQTADVKQKLDNHLCNLNELQRFQAKRNLAVRQANLFSGNSDKFQKSNSNS